MQDRITVQNQTQKPVSLELALEFGNDFADIFAVKNYDFALGDPRQRQGAAAARSRRVYDEEREPVRPRSTTAASRAPRSSSRSAGSSSRTRCASGSSSSRARRGSSASTSCRRSTAARWARTLRSSGSERSATGSRPRSRPGTCACRGCARRGTTSITCSRGPSPTSRRSGCRARAGSGTFRPQGCRGS